MTDFDADAWDAEMRARISALEPPTVRIGGRVRKGRILSFEQWRVYEPEMMRAATLAMSEAEMRRFILRYVARVFPEPAWRIIAEPIAILAAVLAPLLLLDASLLVRAGVSVGCLTATLLIAARLFPSVAVVISRWSFLKQTRALRGFLIAQRSANAVWLELQTGDENTT